MMHGLNTVRIPYVNSCSGNINTYIEPMVDHLSCLQQVVFTAQAKPVFTTEMLIDQSSLSSVLCS